MWWNRDINVFKISAHTENAMHIVLNALYPNTNSDLLTFITLNGYH